MATVRGLDNGYCCSRLRLNDEQVCDIPPSPWDCPDFVIVRLGSGAYGLPVRDGRGSSADSAIEILYCPWCGSTLPGHPSRRPTKVDREAGREAWDAHIRSQDTAARDAIARFSGRAACLSKDGTTAGYSAEAAEIAARFGWPR